MIFNPPSTGLSSPASVRKRVVLPDPDGPAIATKSPSEMDKSRPLTSQRFSIFRPSPFAEISEDFMRNDLSLVPIPGSPRANSGFRVLKFFEFPGLHGLPASVYFDLLLPTFR